MMLAETVNLLPESLSQHPNGGGGGDGRGTATSSSGSGCGGGASQGGIPSATPANNLSDTNPHAPSATAMQQQNDPQKKLSSSHVQSSFKAAPAGASSQKDDYFNEETSCIYGPNELFFGTDRPSGLCYKDREERVRQLRERQQIERQQKLEELKEQAAVAQKFREQQETFRRRRLEEMRSRESERRNQVEERKKLIEQADQDRREAVLRRSAEREHRLDLKRRQERSNAVFAFGSSTPRMLDPKENSPGYWASRRATSTTNVNMTDSVGSVRRASECAEPDLGRKRATSAHSLNRKPEEDLMTRSLTVAVPTAARRRTDLLPAMLPMRDSGRGVSKPSGTISGSPRHRSPGIRSGAVTPNSPSRPTSSLSQGSGSGSQVTLRSRASPRKPRPLSIAGSTPSAAEKPRENLPTPNRESRPIERKSSQSSSTPKPARAKSSDGGGGSDPSTPQRTPSTKVAAPKRTPAQVKAESAAKKAMALEKNKPTPKPRTAPKSATPAQSPAAESKPIAAEKRKISKPKESPPLPPQKDDTEAKVENLEEKVDVKSDVETNDKIIEVEPVELAQEDSLSDKPIEVTETENAIQDVEDVAPDQAELIDKPPVEESTVVGKEEPKSEAPNSEMESKTEEAKGQKASEKPVTGYATEEAYKAALAEKRRQAREAKERELEMERQRKLEEEEKERREEEEYLRLMEEQKKVEEERLQKAIAEAEKQRVEEAKKKEEEEKQKVEAEKLEQQKQLEAEEKLRKEEEERQARKSRVAAIMARTRGSKAANSSPKTEAKTPDESRSTVDPLMCESFIADMSSSMTDSMIAQAIESRSSEKETSSSEVNPSDPSTDTSAPTIVVSMGDASTLVCPSSVDEPSSQLPKSFNNTESDTLVQINPQVESTTCSTSEENKSVSISVKEESRSTTTTTILTTTQEIHVNGDTVPMETSNSPTVDLLTSFGTMNGVKHNGVATHSSFKENIKSGNSFDTFDPLLGNTISLDSKSDATTFDQIIDLNQTNLTNEDAVNSNTPSSPIIAFEENLNKRQSQDSSNVPDILL